MADYLHKHQIDSSKPVQDAAEIGKIYYDYKGDCPTAELLSGCALVIPSYESLSKGEIENIAQCLNQGWAATSSGDLKSKSAGVDYCQKEPNVSAEV
jgi:hypothetical protein